LRFGPVQVVRAGSLGQVYKQIDAPFDQLAKSTLKASIRAITSNSNGDQTYVKLENAIANCTADATLWRRRSSLRLMPPSLTANPSTRLKRIGSFVPARRF
jgi:hypothetical protein